MANQTITADAILVHGRGSLSVPYKVNDSSGTQIDLSTWTIRFEVDGVPITTLLVADPGDVKGKLIQLTRTQVATLSKTATRFAVIDETNAANDLYNVLWSGTIVRTDYVGPPDTTNDA